MPFHRAGGTAWLIPTTATNQDIKSYSANACKVSPVIVGMGSIVIPARCYVPRQPKSLKSLTAQSW